MKKYLGYIFQNNNIKKKGKSEESKKYTDKFWCIPLLSDKELPVKHCSQVQIYK